MNQLWNMLVLARVMTRGALLRDESRGAHYKVPDLDKGVTEENALPRDDANFLKTTNAEHTVRTGRRSPTSRWTSPSSSRGPRKY